jgi:uncharacterized protein (DUF924 family)/glutathione S-transferase
LFCVTERLLVMQTRTLLVESTSNCGQTPRLLLLLEELEAPYELELQPDGYFFAAYGRPGPRLVDGDLTLLEPVTMLRHCARTRAAGRLIPRSLVEQTRVDTWLDCSALVGLTVMSLLREEREQGPERRTLRIADERAKLAAILQTVERALEDSDGDWLLGDFGLADCAMASLARLSRFVDFAPWPGVRAYCERLAARPALKRAQAQLAARPAPATASPDQVLEFWFGAPATTETEMMTKAQRWFAGGKAMDDEVKARFADTVEAAVSGKLDAWTATTRGRLALILVLDQLTRHALRGKAWAFAGDPKAQQLATEAFDAGLDETLSTPERLFLSMPLLHSENTAHLQRCAELARRIARSAPALLAKGSAMHIEQADKYLAIVTRFGRFPHRNAVLGRVSTAEEEAFLVDWAEKAAPRGAPRPVDSR